MSIIILDSKKLIIPSSWHTHTYYLHRSEERRACNLQSWLYGYYRWRHSCSVVCSFMISAGFANLIFAKSGTYIKTSREDSPSIMGARFPSPYKWIYCIECLGQTS